MKFLIDRSKWRSGNIGEHAIGKGYPMMLNNEGFMCCLGQCSAQYNEGSVDIFGFATPAGVAKKYRQVLNGANKVIRLLTQVNGNLISNSDFSEQAMEINDDPELSTEIREEMLRYLFESEGHEIEFSGEPVPYHDLTEE